MRWVCVRTRSISRHFVTEEHANLFLSFFFGGGGVGAPLESITAQHLLGTDWIRLWTTDWDGHSLLLMECLEQLVHVLQRALTLPRPRLSNSSQMCSVGFKSGDMEGQRRIWTLLLARNLVVWSAAWGLALSCRDIALIQRLMSKINREKTSAFLFLNGILLVLIREARWSMQLPRRTKTHVTVDQKMY